ncbi:hypothetical protein [Halapricum desulfuricans]|uniref:hypothetical protein n=1 Tax=Halapricum desulfuricans TaxID=2841257 RepID=UPI001E40D31D|nr:hypothetical protein [Halapricum desulfuricans]
MVSQESEPAVTVAGDSEVTLADAPATRERFPWQTRSFTINCHSGREIEGRWSGVPIAPVAEAAQFPPEATHLLMTADDGYRVCIDAWFGLEGFVGFVCEALTVEGGEAYALRETPRFLAPEIDSSRTIRNLSAIEAIELQPGEDARDYETGH